MGIPMSMPTVHEEPLRVQFRANSFGSCSLFLFGVLAVLILPVVIGVSMGQFWHTFSTFVATPEVNYTGRAALYAVDDAGGEYMWSSSELISELLQGDPRAVLPMVSHYSDDSDGDGKADTVSITVQMQLTSPERRLVSFRFLPVFDYDLNGHVHVKQKVAADIFYGSGADAQRRQWLSVDGWLRFRQPGGPLSASPYMRYDVGPYAVSYLDELQWPNELADLSSYAIRFAARNQTAVFDPSLVAWRAGVARKTVDAVGNPRPLGDDVGGFSARLAHSGVVTIDTTVRIAPAVVEYIPSFGEMLKLSWIQYYALAVVIAWIVDVIKRFSVLQAIVNTVALVRS